MVKIMHYLMRVSFFALIGLKRPAGLQVNCSFYTIFLNKEDLSYNI